MSELDARLKKADDCLARFRGETRGHFIGGLAAAGAGEAFDNVCPVDNRPIGKALTEHPAMKALAFIGESGTGSLIMSQGAPTLKRVHLELAERCRVFAMLGWTELIYNYITERISGPDRHFLINPFGPHYSEVTASNLVRIDLAGNVIGHSDWPANPAGFTVHAAIHDGIADAHCVMHTHTTAGMAVACSQAGLSISNFYSAQLHGKLARHDFEDITVHADEGPRLRDPVRDAGDGAGDRGARGGPAPLHRRLAAVRSALRRRARHVRRAGAAGR